MRTETERLAKYKADFLEKVKKWRWEEVKECTYKKRGRRAKVIERIESKPRSEGEKRVFKQFKYN
jgi:hypothetical protein